MWSPAAVFAEIEPRVPASLVDSTRLASCRRVASTLRGTPTSYYLECRLDDDPQADFLVMFCDRADAASCADAPPGTAWVSNLPVLTAPAEPEEVPFVWLEYDVDERFDRERPQPSVSIGLERGYLDRYWRAPAVAIEDVSRRARRALALLGRGDSQPLLARCASAIPPGGSLVYLSVMTARPRALVKLYVSIPKGRTVKFLRTIGWRGDLTAVDALVRRAYAPMADTVFADLSLGETVLPRLGLAFSQLHRREMETFDPCWSWLPMATALPEKRRALASWPGQAEARIDGWRTCVHRWVDLKAVLDGDGNVRWKAYLGFMPQLPLPFA
jgi:hypothetical protein